MTLGKKLRQFRVKRKISQAIIEAKAGMSIGQLSRIEHGKTKPTFITVQKLVQILVLEDREKLQLLESKLLTSRQ